MHLIWLPLCKRSTNIVGIKFEQLTLVWLIFFILLRLLSVVGSRVLVFNLHLMFRKVYVIIENSLFEKLSDFRVLNSVFEVSRLVKEDK